MREVIAAKAVGDDQGAKDAIDRIADVFGKHEIAIERYYDHCLTVNALKANYGNIISHNEYMDVEDGEKKAK